MCVYVYSWFYFSLLKQKKRGPLLLEINVVCLVTNPILKTQLLSILMLQLPALHIIIILVHLYGHAIQINGSQTMIIIIKKKKKSKGQSRGRNLSYSSFDANHMIRGGWIITQLACMLSPIQLENKTNNYSMNTWVDLS